MANKWGNWTGYGGWSDTSSDPWSSPANYMSWGYPAIPEAKKYIPPATPATPTASTLKIPTAQEMYGTLGGQSAMGKWGWLYDWMGKIGGNPLLQQLAYPTVQSAMRSIFRSGLPSSSAADRAIAALAEQYAPYKLFTGQNWLENILG
jgi:hypothetical protein